MRQPWSDDRIDDLNRKVDEWLEKIDQRFEKVEGQIVEVKMELARVGARVEELGFRLGRFESRVDNGLEKLQHLVIGFGGMLLVAVLAPQFL